MGFWTSNELNEYQGKEERGGKKCRWKTENAGWKKPVDFSAEYRRVYWE